MSLWLPLPSHLPALCILYGARPLGWVGVYVASSRTVIDIYVGQPRQPRRALRGQRRQENDGGRGSHSDRLRLRLDIT